MAFGKFFKRHSLKKLIADEFKFKPKRNPQTICYPSLHSFSLIFLFWLILYLTFNIALSNFIPQSFIITSDSNVYQNFISIITGVLVIVFALIVFIAESSRETRTKDKVIVLLKVSCIYPLSVFTLLNYINFIFIPVNLIFVYVVLILNIFLSIHSIYNLVRALISQKIFLEKRAELLADSITNSIQAEIEKILSIYLLNEKYKPETIKFTYFKEVTNDYIQIKSPKKGIIYDIDMKQLRKLDCEIKKYITLNPKNRPAYSNFGISYEVNKNDVILYIHRDLQKAGLNIKKVERTAKRVFVVKSSPIETYVEFSILKDELLTAIDNKNFSAIEEICDLYLKFWKTYFNYFNYPILAWVHTEHMQIPLSEIEWWITKDIKLIIKRALLTHDLDVIDRVIHLPAEIAILSFLRDHYIFYQMLCHNTIYLYNFAVEWEQDKSIKNYLIERSVGFIKELTIYSILPKFDECRYNREISQIESLLNFTNYIFKIFLYLLIESFKANDFNSFEKFLETIQGLRSKIENQLNFEDIEKLENKIHEMFFIFASFILSKFIEKSDSSVKNFYDRIQLNFTDEIELMNTFLGLLLEEAENFWDWFYFDVPSKEGIQHIDFVQNLRIFFIVKLLSLLEDRTHKIMKFLETYKTNTNFQLQIKDFIEILGQINKNLDKWEILLSENALNQVKPLLEFFESA